MDRWERDMGHAMLDASTLATDNAEWHAIAEKQRLNLLPVGVQRPALKLANGNIFQEG